jgi:hypothetical protein
MFKIYPSAIPAFEAEMVVFRYTAGNYFFYGSMRTLV